MPAGSILSGRTLFLIALAGVLRFYPHVLLFVFPGCFILFSSNRFLYDPQDSLKALAHVCAISLAFWVFSYWITMMVPIKLTHLFYACNIVFLLLYFALFMIQSKSTRLESFFSLKWVRGDFLLLFLFVLVCIARLAPSLNRITGSTGDMSQHNYMIKIIMLNNGYTDSYEPVMPFKHFGEYPLGFHTLCALVSMLGGLDFYRVSNFMSCASFILLHLSLYVFLSRSFSKILSLSVSTLVLMLTHYPQFLNQWGSAPTALSTAFLFFFWTFLQGIWEGKHCGLVEKFGSALVGAAGFLSHLVPPIGFLIYFAGSVAFSRLLRRGSFKMMFNHWEIFVLAASLCVPYILHFDFSVFHSSKEALISGHEGSFYKIVSFLKFPVPYISSIVWPFIEFCFIFGPVFTLLIAASAVYLLFWVRREENIFYLVQLFGSIVIFFGIVSVFTHRLFFFYHLLQSERVHYFILFPASWVAAAALRSFVPAVPVHMRLVLCGAFLFFMVWNTRRLKSRDFESHYTTYKDDRRMLPFLASDALFGSYFSYAFDRGNSYCTPSDLKAFAWIKEHTPPDSVFLTNMGDGGPLIPSIAERKIVFPHGMDLWHARELDAWQKSHPPDYIFTSKTSSPKYAQALRAEELDADSLHFKKLYDVDGAAVYRILSPKKGSS